LKFKRLRTLGKLYQPQGGTGYRCLIFSLKREFKMSNFSEMSSKIGDDSHIDYDHEIWQLAITNGIDEELIDFVSKCFIESGTEEN